VLCIGWAVWGLLQGLPAAAQASVAGIYTCVDANGRRHTSDRPIRECMDREQMLRNSDGSVRQTLPPSYSAEERAARDEQRRRAEAAEVARKDRVRRDRNLLARYPDVAAHQRARDAALEPMKLAGLANERRMAELERERRTLANEAEFYVGRELPSTLKSRIDANRVTIEAQRAAAANNEAERLRILARYDDELNHLRQLWAGTAPGSTAARGGSAPPP
jgi:hypothetical protein